MNIVLLTFFSKFHFYMNIVLLTLFSFFFFFGGGLFWSTYIQDTQVLQILLSSGFQKQ
jgi:hypothetical protein